MLSLESSQGPDDGFRPITVKPAPMDEPSAFESRIRRLVRGRSTRRVETPMLFEQPARPLLGPPTAARDHLANDEHSDHRCYQQRDRNREVDVQVSHCVVCGPVRIVRGGAPVRFGVP